LNEENAGGRPNAHFITLGILCQPSSQQFIFFMTVVRFAFAKVGYITQVKSVTI